MKKIEKILLNLFFKKIKTKKVVVIDMVEVSPDHFEPIGI